MKIPSEQLEVIERRRKMTLKDILESRPYEIVTIHKESTISDAVNLMSEKNVSGLFVVDKDNKLTGIFTERPDRICYLETFSRPPPSCSFWVRLGFYLLQSPFPRLFLSHPGSESHRPLLFCPADQKELGGNQIHDYRPRPPPRISGFPLAFGLKRGQKISFPILNFLLDNLELFL